MSAIKPQFTTLSYPLYACDFDPSDATRLVVAGGGGASRAGVPNQISLLKTAGPDVPIHVSSEIELAKDEDNVTSLAVGHRKGRWSLVYAGVNSGPEDTKKGINTHFRAFSVDLPSKAKSPKISHLARTALFSATDQDTYQRLLRLSEPFEGLPQVGACATGLSKKPQIVLFDVPATGSTAPKARSRLDLAKDAVDVDIIQTGADAYKLAYCDEYEMSLLDVAAKAGTAGDGPAVAFTMTADEAAGSRVRPAFRALRFLTPGFVLAAANLPNRGGALLTGLRLLAGGPARLSVSARLPKTMTQATGLAVRNLAPPPTPSTPVGEAQFVVAVAGSDHSIALYTLEHQTAAGIEALVRLLPFHTLRAVHELHITGLALSHFRPPPKPSARHPQHLRLASVSVKNTVVVHHIPLRRVADRPPATAAARRAGPPRPPRYVVALPSRAPSPVSLFLFIAAVTALLAAVLQGVLEIKGLAAPVLGAHRVTPASWHAPPGAVRPGGPLAAFLAAGAAARSPAFNRLVLREADAAADGSPPADAPHGIEVTHHDEEAHGDAVPWQELPPEQRAKWRARLEKAGQWSGEMGETVFKGILFSEIAGAVGGLVGG